MSVIDKAPPMKERRIKQNPQGEIADEIKNRHKLFKKLKNQDIYMARYKVRRMIFNKKERSLK